MLAGIAPPTPKELPSVVKREFIEKEKIITEATEMDISTSQKYKDDQRLEYIKEHCIYKYKAC